MIVVTRSNGGITIEGHARYAPHGQDVVCAGISTLAQTLVQSFEDLCSDPISYDLRPGWVEIKHGELSAKAQVLVNSFFVGCNMIAETYPDYVKVINTGASIEPPTKKAME